MRITVRGKNIEITPALRDYVEKKMGKLPKLLDDITEATVTLGVERDRHMVEVTVPVGGRLLRGEVASGDMYASIDMVIEKLEKQIEKYKTRLARKVKNGSVLDLAAGVGGRPADEEEPHLVRTKRFAVKPMPVDEALLQMNLLGHDFFVFRNAETEEVNVVYRRRDGNYGLIEPLR
ncbi:ribosome hibernation-promoting factor, HPF/YfiA family [Gelria sp. Kuro-4]|uniref:ribosome hibernation-promoting factor, HPF/YfiA family n=1 Tax=Gelria sp. Kuro-4 TaxID=2796927 RepID=UPI001BEEDE67|nr:ribosome-associated translation inhibitor RaiA [Gelria sp. Kuro-4]BCV25484.1 ribosomal subunit interface protein [Gelria sp. Kuro-4]